MDRLKWCFKQKKGIELIKPNKTIASNYLQRAKSDLKVIPDQNSVWEVIVSYYACYNALYALLLRIGIKCEIHSCTLLLLKLFPSFQEFNHFMVDLKEKRINTQYYLKEPEKVDIKTVDNETLPTAVLVLSPHLSAEYYGLAV